MPKHYPAELRRRTCERMLAGEAVKDLSAELGIYNVTLYKWRRRALIDAGQRQGQMSYEADPLAAARRRVKELEAELKAGPRRPATSSRRAAPTQKQVPGCPKAEQPGLLRALRLSDRRPRPLDPLRHQVQKAQRPRDPSPDGRMGSIRKPKRRTATVRASHATWRPSLTRKFGLKYRKDIQQPLRCLGGEAQLARLPWKPASPKPKMPPSAATSQYP